MNGGEFKLGLPSLGTYAGLVRACGRVRRPGPTRELALRLEAILTPPPLADMHVRMLNSWSPGWVSWPGKVVADVRLGLGMHPRSSLGSSSRGFSVVEGVSDGFAVG